MSPYEITIQILLGVLLADLISGIVHWFEDTYGDPNWPIIGLTVMLPNILHHEDPLKFTKAPLFKRTRGVLGVAFVVGGHFQPVWLAQCHDRHRPSGRRHGQ